MPIRFLLPRDQSLSPLKPSGHRCLPHAPPIALGSDGGH